MKVSSYIETLVPYPPGKPITETKREYGVEVIHKLASNENALGFSPKVRDALLQGLDHLYRYPDPTCYTLIETISKTWSVDRSHIAVGNGSNEIFDILIRIYCEKDDAILTFESAFVAYEICAQACRSRTLKIPLGQNFAMSLDQMATFLEKNAAKERIRLVFIPNPNNPTGVYLPKSEMLAFLDRCGHSDDFMIVVDEAYTEFVRAEERPSLIEEFKNYKNVLILRTLSKAYGLAGLRVGIMLAPPKTVDFFNRVRSPFNVNELAQIGATAALQDASFVKRSVAHVWQQMDTVFPRLKELGLTPVPSQANFILFDTHQDAAALNIALLKRGVILRPVANYGHPTYFRMTLGTEQENQRALQALQEVLINGDAVRK